MKGDWKKTVSEYRASGMSQAEFSRLRGISKSSLAYQVRRSERAKYPDGAVVEVKLKGGRVVSEVIKDSAVRVER